MSPVIAVGNPTGLGAVYHAGETEVKVTNVTGTNGSDTYVLYFDAYSLADLFNKIGDRLFPEGWSVDA